MRGGAIERAEARREVILRAGAIGSPHILQLSGVGDPDHLGRHRRAGRTELRGVGKNMQDHQEHAGPLRRARLLYRRRRCADR